MRSILLAVLIMLAFALNGCTHTQSRNIALAGLAADMISTNHGINSGCVEGNPIFRENENAAYATGVALAIGVWYFSEWLEKNDGPHWPLTLAGILRFHAAYQNFTIDCK